MTDVLLFLPIHCRKTTLFYSTRDILRGKYRETPNPKRLKSQVPGMENEDLFQNLLDQREGARICTNFVQRDINLGNSLLLTLSAGAEDSFWLKSTLIYSAQHPIKTETCYSYYPAFFPSTQLWSIDSNTM